MIDSEAKRLRDSISIGERQLSGMQQHLHRLETETAIARDRLAAARSSLESLRGRLKVIEAGQHGLHRRHLHSA